MLQTLAIFYLVLAAPAARAPLQVAEELEDILAGPILQQITAGIDSLLVAIDEDRLDATDLDSEHLQLAESVLGSLRTTNVENELDPQDHIQGQLLNAYPIDTEHYAAQVVFMDVSSPGNPVVQRILDLVVVIKGGRAKFDIPLSYQTRHWQSTTVGSIRYLYKDKLNLARAAQFDGRNTLFAEKLGLPVEQFDFYMCENYQEILSLLGLSYDAESSGIFRNGYGVDANTIFSIMNNEDFSHDLFHYYSGKLHERSRRNWLAEEGIAYSWGNAYWTDPSGAMIEQAQLLPEIRRYVASNPAVDLLGLLERAEKGFTPLAPEVSAGTTLASLICDEIERIRGVEGLLELVNCGRTPDLTQNFLQTAQSLLSLDRAALATRLAEILEERALQ